MEKRRTAKNPHAVALGRLGGRRGGPARRRSLSPEVRSAIGQLAVQKRWIDVKGKKFSAAKITEVERRADRDVLEVDMRLLCRAAGLSSARTTRMMQLGFKAFDLAGHLDRGFSALALVTRALGGKLRVVVEVRKKKIILVEY
jgi:hypothetical protein